MNTTTHSMPAPMLVLLHAGEVPVVDPGDCGFAILALRVEDADPVLSTLPGMARDLLGRLPDASSCPRIALAALGTCASTFAQALALELLGRDREVACVALVPDAALPTAGHATVDDRLAAACAAWAPPEPAMLPVQRCPASGVDVVDWILRTATAAPMPSLPPAVMALPLQLGGPQRTPIVCIPGAGASVVSLLDLAQAAHPQATVYGMQPRGIDGLAPLCTTVETAADAVVAQIGQLLPQGPLRLVGHSFGGWIAFETALRLRAAGRAIVSLDLLDSRAPDPASDHREWDDLSVLVHWATLLALSAGRPLGLDAETLRPLSAQARLQLVHRRMGEAGLLPMRSAPSSIAGALRMFAACMRTRYTPSGTYDGTLRVVHLRNPALDAEANARAALARRDGWATHALRVQLLCGEGNHMTGIRGAHARTLAEQLGFAA